MASKRRIRRNACGNKKRHPDIAAAQYEVRRLLRRGSAERHKGFLKPYLCRFCSGWHIGHS